MAQTIINNGDSGSIVRNALNGMLRELYAAIVLPLRLPGINTNTQQIIPANTYVKAAFIKTTAGNPIIRIGTIPNGSDILSDTEPGNNTPITVEEYFEEQAIIYITVSGGTVNIRLDILIDFY